MDPPLFSSVFANDSSIGHVEPVREARKTEDSNGEVESFRRSPASQRQEV